MTKDRLTRNQQKLVRDLERVLELLRLDYRNILDYDYDSRTPHIQRMRDHVVRGEVVTQYTLMDEYLNGALCDYFFGRKRNAMQLWRTKKFRNFNYYVLEKLSLMEKFQLLRAVRRVPKFVVADIERLNNLRNGIAHAFFPENLRSAKPLWKGKSIHAVDGLEGFIHDMANLSEWFVVEVLCLRRSRRQPSTADPNSRRQ